MLQGRLSFIDTYFTACGYLELKFEIEYYILYDKSLSNFSPSLLEETRDPLSIGRGENIISVHITEIV